MDVLLDQRAEAEPLITAAESGLFDLVVPEYVIREFKGTAARRIEGELREIRALQSHRARWNKWGILQEEASKLDAPVREVEAKVLRARDQIAAIVLRIEAVAQVVPHDHDTFLRAELRFLEGQAPVDGRGGREDCHILEAALTIFSGDTKDRPRYFVTSDSDFEGPHLDEAFRQARAERRSDLGKIYGEVLSKGTR